MNLFMQSIIDGILNGAIYAVIALGLTLIFGVMKIINMAHGEFVMLGMFSTYFIYQYAGLDPYLTIPFTGIIVFLFGLLMYQFGVGKIPGLTEENSLLFTAGASLFIANLAQFLWSPNYRRLDLPYGVTTLQVGDLAISVTKIISLCIVLVCVIGLWYFLHKTFVGMAIRASSQEKIAASLMGINVKRIAMITFGIGAGFSAIAGTLLTAEIAFYPTVGTIFIIKAFIVVVLGGMGNIPGAAVGGIILGVAESLGAVYVSSGFTDAYGLIIFLLILLFRPQGLLGRKV
ncbi:branched-chain amino acid transport system permease protein [Caldalkalibacillus uzonensis]|uniref:Branched-chain amino acid transport system permease protein n=1 Tax=Caldalkalibacillus uzonensis TaxID=353224 RepID=A0ABU0CP03_9BACI|nr:branched-chain amino acid ABC transporter permease [Caldalkalibacillus uzonensis]MDQ0338143.1 branched-chain amino acid transport system permease protein [Caldalkalibacillus uzonensis]